MTDPHDGSTMRDLLDGLARPAALCAYCPKMCTSACPVSEAEARETVTPWAKMSLVHLARAGQVSLGEPRAQQALEACTGCGACAEKCAHGNPVAETLFVARGASGSMRAARFREAFVQTGDVKGRDHRRVLDGLTRDAAARIAYFPGCAQVGVADGGDRVRRDLRALERALGATVSACDLGPPEEGKAQCCGYPLYVDGQLDLVEENFRRLANTLRGHELVVTPDPGCAYMLTTVFKALGAPALAPGAHDGRDGRDGRAPSARIFPAVLPLVEVLSQHAERFAGAAKDVVVRYHDPCYLARRGRSTEAPRRLLHAATGRWPLEFHRNRDDAVCSGSGGLYPVSNPEGARTMARRRVTQDPAAHEAAEWVVTACPSARRGFERAGVPVVDVVEMVLGELPRARH